MAKFGGYKQAAILLIFILPLIISACSAEATKVIEATATVPQIIIITQIVTQLVTPIISATPIPTNTPEPTVTPTAVQVYYPIEECAPSILERGMYVYISYTGGRNALRAFPDLTTGDNIVGYAVPGELLHIVGGPACSYHWLMWQVETNYGLIGWTPEGNGSDWWLLPVK